MSVEIYYAPKEGAAPVTFSEAQSKFAAAGLPCTVESEGPDMHWVVFEGSETTILASVKGNDFVLATVHASFDEEPQFTERLDAVLQSMGFSAETEDF